MKQMESKMTKLKNDTSNSYSKKKDIKAINRLIDQKNN